ncbi:MAG: hypothetical protein ABI746_07130 [Dermatophilaceae bacterium]
MLTGVVVLFFAYTSLFFVPFSVPFVAVIAIALVRHRAVRREPAPFASPGRPGARGDQFSSTLPFS